VGQALPEAPCRLSGRLVVLWGAATLATLIAVAAVAGLFWLRAYDPLAWAGGTFGAPSGSLEWKQIEDAVHGPVYYVSAEETGAFEVGVDVTNTGELPLELVGLGMVSELAGLRMGRNGTWVDSNGAGKPVVPFRPITIEPDEGRYLVLQFRVALETACGPSFAPGTTRTFDTASLRYRYAGAFERSAAVELPFTVVLACGDLPPS
jgi:hypothetical protein